MAFCLKPEEVDAFKQALLSKKLSLDDLLDPKMTSEERTGIFREYAGDNAKEVNQLFESKLVLKNRILGIQNFIKKVGELGRYSAAGKAAAEDALAAYKAQQFERIFSPAENEAFLNDLADKAVGVHVSRDVAQNIFDLSRKADALRDVDPKMSGVSDEYLLARNALNAYVATQKNTGPIADIAKNLAITGRNMMLLGVSTPLKVADSTAINTAVDMIGRRIASGTYITDPDVAAAASQASQEAWQTFRATGQNTASMEGLNDAGLGKLGERLSFSNIPGSNATGAVGAVGDAVRAVARVTNKIAIDWEHNYIFTKAYQTTFFDGAGLLAKNVADEMGLEPADVFRDAVRIEPETLAGRIVRSAAQEQAMRVLNVNNTILSEDFDADKGSREQRRAQPAAWRLSDPHGQDPGERDRQFHRKRRRGHSSRHPRHNPGESRHRLHRHGNAAGRPHAIPARLPHVGPHRRRAGHGGPVRQPSR